MERKCTCGIMNKIMEAKPFIYGETSTEDLMKQYYKENPWARALLQELNHEVFDDKIKF